MPYVPPPPGSTAPGQPTPSNVPKQDVHINDLPPEVRKSFLLSMVFFPTLVGAVICAVIFLGWWTVFETKKPEQFAKELLSPDARRRKVAQRELAEQLSDKAIYNKVTLDALLEMLNNKELDKDAASWSPAAMIRSAEEEPTSSRWWAAAMIGRVAPFMPDAADRTRARVALEEALKEKNLGIYAARGLSFMRDPQSRDALVARMEQDKDAALKMACASALGAIGEYIIALSQGLDSPNAEDKKYSAEKLESFGIKPDKQAVENVLKTLRDPLYKAFEQTDAKELQDNAAIALARMRDPLGKDHLTALAKSDDTVVREHAQRALDILNGTRTPGKQL